MRTLLFASLSTLLAVPAIAQAQDATAAEKERLLAEMERLAQKNQWAGVDKAYVKADALGGDLFFEAHVLGAQAAKNLGDPWNAVLRLRKAKTITYDADVVAELQTLEANFGKVWITISGKKRPELTPEKMPFDPTQRASIDWARAQLSGAGAFRGMLPAGTYTVGIETFQVLIGEGNFLRVQVDGDLEAAPAVAAAPEPEPEPKPAPEPEPEPEPAVAQAPAPELKPRDPAAKRPTQEQLAAKQPREPKPKPEPAGLAIGPLVMVGGGYVMSPPPGPDEDVTVIQPGPSGWGGVSITGGLELTAGIVGGAVGLVASPGFGSSYFHQVGGWGALVLRPGPIHVAVGPSFTYLWGEGTGVADWFDRGQDPNLVPADTIEWQGSATAMGARLELGVAPMEVGPFDLLVSLGGSYQNDGMRNYLGGGLSIGIVPKQ